MRSPVVEDFGTAEGPEVHGETKVAMDQDRAGGMREPDGA